MAVVARMRTITRLFITGDLSIKVYQVMLKSESGYALGSLHQYLSCSELVETVFDSLPWKLHPVFINFFESKQESNKKTTEQLIRANQKARKRTMNQVQFQNGQYQGPDYKSSKRSKRDSC